MADSAHLECREHLATMIASGESEHEKKLKNTILECAHQLLKVKSATDKAKLRLIEDFGAVGDPADSEYLRHHAGIHLSNLDYTGMDWSLKGYSFEFMCVPEPNEAEEAAGPSQPTPMSAPQDNDDELSILQQTPVLDGTDGGDAGPSQAAFRPADVRDVEMELGTALATPSRDSNHDAEAQPAPPAHTDLCFRLAEDDESDDYDSYDVRARDPDFYLADNDVSDSDYEPVSDRTKKRKQKAATSTPARAANQPATVTPRSRPSAKVAEQQPAAAHTPKRVKIADWVEPLGDLERAPQTLTFAEIRALPGGQKPFIFTYPPGSRQLYSLRCPSKDCKLGGGQNRWVLHPQFETNAMDHFIFRHHVYLGPLDTILQNWGTLIIRGPEEETEDEFWEKVRGFNEPVDEAGKEQRRQLFRHLHQKALAVLGDRKIDDLPLGFSFD